MFICYRCKKKVFLYSSMDVDTSKKSWKWYYVSYFFVFFSLVFVWLNLIVSNRTLFLLDGIIYIFVPILKDYWYYFSFFYNIMSMFA